MISENCMFYSIHVSMTSEIVVEWQSIIHWSVGSIPDFFIHKIFIRLGLEEMMLKEAEYHGPTIWFERN